MDMYPNILAIIYATQQVVQTDFMQILFGIIDQSALAGLAVFSIWMLNKVWNDRLASVERHATQMAALQQEAIEVIKNNTAVMTKLTERLH